MPTSSLRLLQSDAVCLNLLRQIHAHFTQSMLFRAASKAAACARQAEAYLSVSKTTPLSVQPLMLYYTILHQFKTWLHLVDPAYPSTTSVLQHGLSARRSKRENYRWSTESLNVYQQGVLQSYVEWRHPGLRLPPRLTVIHLLGSIPELVQRLSSSGVMEGDVRAFEVMPLEPPALGHDDTHAGYPPRAAQQTLGGSNVGERSASPAVDGDGAQGWPRLGVVARSIASVQGLTVDEWRQQYDNLWREEDVDLCAGTLVGSRGAGHEFIKDTHDVELGVESTNEARTPTRRKTGDGIRPRDPLGGIVIRLPQQTHPLRMDWENRTYLRSADALPLDVTHYTTLYGLSALCRYNPLEWSDILHWQGETDALLVREYVDLALRYLTATADAEMEFAPIPGRNR